VPTLRNVDLRVAEGDVKAFGHNGYFKSLEEIVHFYNTRDVAGAGWMGEPWPEPEYADTVNTAELGDLKLELRANTRPVTIVIRAAGSSGQAPQGPYAASRYSTRSNTRCNESALGLP